MRGIGHLALQVGADEAECLTLGLTDTQEPSLDLAPTTSGMGLRSGAFASTDLSNEVLTAEPLRLPRLFVPTFIHFSKIRRTGAEIRTDLLAREPSLGPSLPLLRPDLPART